MERVTERCTERREREANGEGKLRLEIYIYIYTHTRTHTERDHELTCITLATNATHSLNTPFEAPSPCKELTTARGMVGVSEEDSPSLSGGKMGYGRGSGVGYGTG
jgi:hypothetical protein